MIWLSRPFVYHRQVDPREAQIESGAPDHVGNIDTTAVFELGLSVLDPGDPGNTFHARCCQVFWLDPDQGLTGGHPLGPDFSSDRCAGGQYSVEDDPPDDRHENPRRHALWRKGVVPGPGPDRQTSLGLRSPVAA